MIDFIRKANAYCFIAVDDTPFDSCRTTSPIGCVPGGPAYSVVLGKGLGHGRASLYRAMLASEAFVIALVEWSLVNGPVLLRLAFSQDAPSGTRKIVGKNRYCA